MYLLTSRNSSLTSHVNNIRYLVKDANLTLSDAKEMSQNASALLDRAKAAYANLRKYSLVIRNSKLKRTG